MRAENLARFHGNHGIWGKITENSFLFIELHLIIQMSRVIAHMKAPSKLQLVIS